MLGFLLFGFREPAIIMRMQDAVATTRPRQPRDLFEDLFVF
jgi:hypothetical protein